MSDAKSIPVEAASYEFTPIQFEGLDDAPSFMIRFGTRGDWHALQDEIRAQSLNTYRHTDYRQAYINELRALGSTDGSDIELAVDAFRRYHEALDDLTAREKDYAETCAQIREQNAALPDGKPQQEFPPAPEFEFDQAELVWVNGMARDIDRASPTLGQMAADEARYARETRRIALALLLESTTLDVPFIRDRRRRASQDTLYAIEDALEQLVLADGSPNFQSFNQLGAQALMSFNLTVEQRKNLLSPLPITPIRSGSTKEAPTPSTTETSNPSPTLESDGTDTPDTSQPNATAT